MGESLKPELTGLRLSPGDANALWWLSDDLRHVIKRSDLTRYELTPDEIRLVARVIEAMGLE